MGDFLLIACIAGLLAVDDRAGWQSLLGEPVFSSLIVGVVLGRLDATLQCGIVLQLAWLSIGAARGTRRPDTVVGGVVGAATTSVVLSRTGDPHETMAIAGGVLVGLVTAQVGAWVSRVAGTWRERRLGNFQLPATYPAASRALAAVTVFSIVVVGLVAFAVAFAMLPLATAFVAAMSMRLGAGATQGAQWWLVCVAAIGVASIVRAFSTRVLVRFLAVGFGVALLVGWLR